LKPETRTVNDLFERDVRYVVPLYQRPYVWDEDDQWEPLWGDILVLLEHQLTNGGQAASYSHFLGAIVVEQETQAPGRIPLYTIIDGQQRLTTLQLLLAAAQSVATDLDASSEAGLLADLVANDPRKADGDERLKVWPTNANRAAFRSALMRDPSVPAADDPANLIQEAHEYFKGKIADWVADADDHDHGRRLTTLRVTLSDLVKVVSITLEPGDNAQIIFETLNARGTPLLALDLVKNAAFHQAARQGHDIDRLYDEVWRPELDQDRWRQDRRQGRLFRAQGELFLMHWLGMKLRRVIPATELFTTFRKDVLDFVPQRDMADLIRELNRDAAIYRSFDEQPSGSPDALFFERLEALDITTVMPLVLLLFTDPSISPTRRRSALGALESWLIRRTLLRLTTKNYNREVAQLLTKVAGDPERADEIVRDHLATSTDDTSRWPDDEELTTALETRDMYYSVAQARLAMVLRAVELSLYDARVDIPTVPTSLSIEHVMPQAWEEHWPLPPIADPEERGLRASERNARLHRIGNLTLTTLPMNAHLSNSDWRVKQKAILLHSKLLLNAELIERYPDLFDEAAIDERTAVLARRICEIWPRPRPVA
jgi:hypothetical protein